MVLILGILVIYDTYQATKYTSRDLVSVTQITDDWEQTPFVEIEIKDQPCEMFGMESIFERVWRGTKKGCNNYYGVIPYDQWRSNDDDDYCDVIYPISPMSQLKFYGKFFCGATGGRNFAEVKRVLPETDRCPDGTEPCSTNTSPSNTVCYPPEDHPTSCPITDIKIIDEDRAQPFLNDTAYTMVPFVDNN